MSTSDQLSYTFLGYLNLDMSNHSYPPFPDLYDYITPPSPSVSYTLPMMPTPISSRLAPPPTPIPFRIPHLLLPFHHLLSYPSESLMGTSTEMEQKLLLLWQNIDPKRPQRPRWRSKEETIKRLVETYN